MALWNNLVYAIDLICWYILILYFYPNQNQLDQNHRFVHIFDHNVIPYNCASIFHYHYSLRHSVIMIMTLMTKKLCFGFSLKKKMSWMGPLMMMMMPWMGRLMMIKGI